MSRTELLELAALDAFGLLDEYETALYTRSFHHAPAAVQDEILEIQARLSSDASLLPRDEPPADLRKRVLNHVANAIDNDASELAPLATIGRRRSDLRYVRSGDLESSAGAVFGRHFWRAAAFVLAGAVIAVSYFWYGARDHANLVAMLSLYDNTSAQLERLIGPTAKDFILDAESERIVLAATDPDAPYRGAVLIADDAPRGLLIIEGLPRAGQNQQTLEYELTVRDENGVEHAVTTFESLDRLGGIGFDLPAHIALGPNATWEVRLNGEVLLA